MSAKFPSASKPRWAPESGHSKASIRAAAEHPVLPVWFITTAFYYNSSTSRALSKTNTWLQSAALYLIPSLPPNHIQWWSSLRNVLSKLAPGSIHVYPWPTVSSLGNTILHVSLEISPSKKHYRASPELASTYLLRPFTFSWEPMTMPLLGHAKGLVYKSPNTK